MYICERCGKGLQVGMNVSHSHRRTKKRSLPNLHVTSIMIGGRKVKSRYCTKCLRIIHASHPRIQEDSVKVTVEETAPKVSKEETPAPSVKVSKNKETHTLSEDIERAASKKEVPEKEPAEEAVPA